MTKADTPPQAPALVLLVADGPVQNGADLVQPGEPFECTEAEAATLEAVGAAHRPGTDPEQA